MLPVSVRRDPAPSRVKYRLQRLWLTPVVRGFVRVGIPGAVLIAMLLSVASDPRVHYAIARETAALRQAIATRPELTITGIDVTGAGPVMTDRILDALALDLPVSALDIDLDALHTRVAALEAVRRARLRIAESGRLAVEVEERLPVIVWLSGDTLHLIDETGARTGTLAERGARADLDLIAGAGADAQVSQALELMRIAAPLRPRIRGLVRVGERRWNIVLDRDQTILLPEAEPAAALARALALNGAWDLLARDIQSVDLRNRDRPMVRLTPRGLDAYTLTQDPSEG